MRSQIWRFCIAGIGGFCCHHRVDGYCYGHFCGAENITKGKLWDIEEVRQLRQLLEEGKNIDEISQIMVKTEEAIRQKMYDLKLKEEEHATRRKSCFSSSKLDLPKDLLTVERTLRILAGALVKSGDAGLDKDEIQRLQVVATLAKTYKELFADYLDYRGIEERLVELEGKYESLIKKSQTNAPT